MRLLSCDDYYVLYETDTKVSGTPDLLACREDFFREEGSNDCVPNCHTWKQFSQAEVIIFDAIIVAANVVGFVAGIIVIVISIIRRKKMLVKLRMNYNDVSFNFKGLSCPLSLL